MTPDLAEITEKNSSFSKEIPGLQIAVDSTSLGAFKTCPRYYYHTIVQGWQPKQTSVHLIFGIHLHRARERYEHQKFAGKTHDEALKIALQEALINTWDKELKRPWASDHSFKNRFTLIRTIVWYLDQFGENDSLETLKLANGKPAVELSFRFDSGFRNSKGESIQFCGHLDRVVEFGGKNYVADIKTTGSQLNPQWFKSWSPGNQFSMYNLGSKVAFSFECSGLIVDGIQIGAGFSRCQRGLVPRTTAVVEEWLSGSSWWLKLMESCARAGEWPMNDMACGKYGGCEFREICSLDPNQRERWLKSGFNKRIWDPLTIRGDI